MSLKSALPKGRAVTRVKALETLGSQAFHLSLPAAFVVAQRRRHPQQRLLLPSSSPSSSSHSSSSSPLSSSVSASPSSSSSAAAAATQSQIHPHPKPAWSRPAVARCPSPPGKKRSLLVAVAGPSGLGPGVFAPPRQTRRLAFHTGASGIGKARTAGGSPPQRFLLQDEAATGEAGRSGDEAATAGVVSVGEDAYFEGDRRDALGVGDGVGGWASTGTPGANAGRFSALLMSAIADEAEREANLPKGPVDIMQAGYERCMLQARSEGLQGSSTALLALLRSAGEQDYLRVASVGDCWLGVVRQVGPHLRRQIVFETQEQQHHFNCPFQLGTNKLSSTPHQHAQDYTFPVEQGDIVVLCSDGLVDNLFENEIIAEINAAPQPLAPQSLSDRLCARAKLASESRAGQRPFGVKAAKAGKLFNGGKVDDISVLVAIIGGSSPPHP